VWDKVESIRLALGSGGMSSDKTEAEGEYYLPRQVRRVARVWISEDVSNMWETVENVGMRQPSKTGNKPLPRIHAAKTSNSSTSSVVAGLPRNFYNSLWWVSLHRSEKELLDRTPTYAIPSSDRLSTRHVLFFVANLMQQTDILGHFMEEDQ